ncbi:hypothetical protein [Clostridium perfringens]
MITWPNNKKFAFTIIDDTDKASINNIKPVYDYLYKSGLITTKTIWALPSKDKFGGQSICDKEYREFIKDLVDKGFEIALHGVGSGDYNREETLYGIKLINETFNRIPKIHINHAHNSDNIYWGEKRFVYPIDKIYKYLRHIAKRKSIISLGDEDNSKYFWGDFCKKNIKYIRNMVFSDINTISCDKYMPYKEKRKEKYSNYWFSSSDGYNCETLIKLLSNENIDKLEKENGCSIVYTHFAYGFVNEKGELNKEFKECIDYLSSKNGWFVPASQILDYLNNNKNNNYISQFQLIKLNIKWFYERIIRKIFGGI